MAASTAGCADLTLAARTAAEAAGGLDDRLGHGERLLDFGELAPRSGQGDLRVETLGPGRGRIRNSELMRANTTCAAVRNLSAEIPDDRPGCAMTCCNRLDHGGRPGHHVTGGEYALVPGHRGLGVGYHQAPLDHGVRGGHASEIGLLTHGGEDERCGNGELGSAHRHGPASAAGICLAEGNFEAFEADHVAFVDQHPAGRGEELELHSFGCGDDHLVLTRGHLLPGAAVDDLDLLGAEPEGGPGGLDRGRSTPDDDHGFGHRSPATLVHPPEESEGVFDARSAVSGYPKALPALCPNRKQHCVVSGGQQSLDIADPRDTRLGSDLDSCLAQNADLGVEHIGRQPVVGDAVAQHAAERGGLEHGDRVTRQPQVVGGRQARRTGADHRHSLALFGLGPGRSRRML